MAWNSGQSLKGQRGAQILFGARDPSASDGFDGDGWINTSNGHLFAQKSNGAWPTTYATLAAVGNAFYSGTAVPGTTTPGNVGDLYFQTGTGTFYQMTSSGWQSLGSVNGTNGTNGSQITYTNAPPGANYGAVGDFAYYPATQTFYSKTNTGWAALGSVTGAKGDQGLAGTNGLSVVSNSAAPTANDGVVGSPAFINTTAGTLYGAKTSSGWPSSFLSLVGQPGAAGVQQPGLYSGSGLPSTSTAPGAVNGSYYINTATQPFTLYGALTNGTWPSTGVSMSGSQIYYQQGAPAAGTGNVNDYAFDTTPGAVKLYPAKTSSGWTVAPVSLTGPQGATGAAGFSTLSSQSAGNERSFGFNNVSVTSTASVPFFNGTNVPANISLPNGSVLYGYSCTNPGVAVSVSLYNVTTSTNVITISIAANVTVSQVYDLTTYQIAANQQYQWRVTGSGTANFSFTPIVLFPAVTSSYNTTFLPAVGNQTSVTYNANQYYLPYAGTTLTNAQKFVKSAFLYAVTITNNASASLSFSYQYTPSGGSTVTLYNVSVAAGATLNAGPFTSSQYVMAANSQASWSVSNSASGTVLVQTQIVYVGG